MKLSDIKINQKAVIASVDTSGLSAKRLMEMGFSAGTEVKKIINGISSNLSAYEVKNTVVALRNKTAELINVFINYSGGNNGE